MTDDGVVSRRANQDGWYKEWCDWRSSEGGPKSLKILRGPLKSFPSSKLKHAYLVPPESSNGDVEVSQIIGLDAIVCNPAEGGGSMEDAEVRAKAILESINPSAIIFSLSPAEYRYVCPLSLPARA